MSLSQIGSIADILAAVGVICSLLFLAYELRISNRETRMANWRQLLDSFREYKAVTNDLALSEVIERGAADYHALAPHEKRSFGQYLEQGIHVIGNFSKHSWTMPNELVGLETATRNSMLELLNTPGARQWWAEYKPKGKLMPETYRVVDAILADGTVQKPPGVR